MLTLNFHLYISKSRLITYFRPLREYLSSQIGQPLEILISSGFQEHINDIDRIDIANMCMHKHLMFRKILMPVRSGGNNANHT